MISGIAKAKEVCCKLNLPVNGYTFRIVLNAIKEQDRDTRHACAEACLQATLSAPHLENVSNRYHDICMNVKAI